METKVVENNYKVLSNLDIGQKLWVKDSGELVKDERWLQGLRRRRDGVSREDIKEPIRKTLVAKLESEKDRESVEQLVRRLKVVLYGTYPDFTGIQDMLNMLLGELPDQSPITGFVVEPVVESKEMVESKEEMVESKEERRESKKERGEEILFEQPRMGDLSEVIESCSSTPLRRSMEEDESSDHSRKPSGFIARLLGFLCIKY